MIKRGGPTRAGAAAGLLAITGVALAAAGEPDTAPAEGERLYRIYCASCHGKDARGDGPTAAVMKKRPTDLRRLAHSRHGEFPAEAVRGAIDGRGPEHGTPEMPIWGLAFQEWDKDTNQEAEVRARIEQLVAYIRSIQD